MRLDMPWVGLGKIGISITCVGEVLLSNHGMGVMGEGWRGWVGGWGGWRGHSRMGTCYMTAMMSCHRKRIQCPLNSHLPFCMLQMGWIHSPAAVPPQEHVCSWYQDSTTDSTGLQEEYSQFYPYCDHLRPQGWASRFRYFNTSLRL